jgi:hypothetical protein
MRLAMTDRYCQVVASDHREDVAVSHRSRNAASDSFDGLTNVPSLTSLSLSTRKDSASFFVFFVALWWVRSPFGPRVSHLMR